MEPLMPQWREDLCWDSLTPYRDKASGQVFFVGWNFDRGGYQHNGTRWTKVTVTDGKLTETTLFGEITEGDSKVYYGADPAVLISEAEYNRLTTAFWNSAQELDSFESDRIPCQKYADNSWLDLTSYDAKYQALMEILLTTPDVSSLA